MFGSTNAKQQSDVKDATSSNQSKKAAKKRSELEYEELNLRDFANLSLDSDDSSMDVASVTEEEEANLLANNGH